MANAPLGTVLRHIGKLAGVSLAAGTTDLQLLCRFTTHQDEDAFAELTRRHGPLVLSVCRRVLGHEQDAEDVERLIRDLDSEDFQTRMKATEELEKMVNLVEPVLRKTLKEKPSLELHRRILQVLSKLESTDRLRTLRAIQVLEYAGTPEAKEHLRTLAKGVDGVRLTREAKSALERLAKR